MEADPARAPRPVAATILLLLMLIGAAALRLPGLASPPTDIHHVRQSDTSSIARIFWRDGIDLLHPRIDWAGADAGTVESELPLYAATTAVLWRVAGRDAPIWPRSLSLLSWFLGGWGLLLLVRRRLPGPSWAYLALYFLSPLGVAFSRTIQPDALAVALMLWSLERADWSGDREEGGALPALTAGLIGGLAVACKGTLAFAAPLLLLLALGRGARGAVGRLLALALPLVALPLAWYVHAHLHLGVDGATFGIWGANAHKWGGIALWLDPSTWRSIGGTLLAQTLTPLGAALVLVGGLAARREAGLRPWVVGLTCGLFATVVLSEGFRLHNYYQLPLLPFASVVVGAGALELRGRSTSWGPARRAVVLLVLLSLGALSAWQGEAFLGGALHRDQRIEVAGRALSYVVPVGRSLVVVDRHPQTLLYAIDRRGWHRTALTYGDVLDLEDLGADYLLVTETSPSWTDAGLMSALQDERPLVARSPGWLLFQLQRELPHRATPEAKTPAPSP